MFLGIDIGGTKTALALASREGRVLARRRYPTRTSGDGERDLAGLAEEARSLLSDAGTDLAAVAQVGVSVPGPLDPARERILQPPNLPGWEGVPIRKRLEAEVGRPVTLENDANAAALAEWQFGAGRGADHVVYLTMSTGVGAGLILDGRLYRGSGGNAGEFGHTTLVEDGALCACGLRGCVEAYVGGAAWTERLRAKTPEQSQVMALAGGRASVRPEHLLEAARAGDAYARAEVDRYNHYLARAISNIVFALAPEVVILGTIPTAAGDELCLTPVRKSVQARIWPALANRLRIVPTALGPELPYLAGICVAMHAYKPSTTT
jgi:glucokinase